MEDVEFLIIGAGPAGSTAAREAARAGVETLVLEKDPVVGAKRVCAAGLRPGFCDSFDLPREIVHCDPSTITLHGPSGRPVSVEIGKAHTTTREELDGTIARLARGEGATFRTQTLFRTLERGDGASIVEYADLASGERGKIRAKSVLFAQGSTVRMESPSPFVYDRWQRGLITCYQYRVYLDRPASPHAYDTLEMHYYVTPSGRNAIAWMFPKRDHLSIGLGIQAKMSGKELREALDDFLSSVATRLFPGVGYTLREEGNLLYGGEPRPTVANDGVMVAGTAAGLVDATTGEGIFEAAMSGRLAARAVATHRGAASAAAERYASDLRDLFYARLRHRHKLMTFLERAPARFDVLFEQISRAPRLGTLLQREKHEYSLAEWFFLYAQGALFGVRALGAGRTSRA